jgi:hypothetical protein
MVDVRRNGDKITISFDVNDPNTKKVLGHLCKFLESQGLKEDSKRIAAAMAKDDPPEIPPGGRVGRSR